MKTAVSIPDDLFADADRLASRFKTSRSQLYARALAEFLARHDDDRITEALNQTYALKDKDESSFVSKASASVLRNSPW
jgi:metal-responsive CopG/Arc/MetJ family transcriptional regulator